VRDRGGEGRGEGEKGGEEGENIRLSPQTGFVMRCSVTSRQFIPYESPTGRGVWDLLTVSQRKINHEH
jgi:hypothetical protein